MGSLATRLMWYCHLEAERLKYGCYKECRLNISEIVPFRADPGYGYLYVFAGVTAVIFKMARYNFLSS